MKNIAYKDGKLSYVTLTEKGKEKWDYTTCEMLAAVQSL
jgi:hypothetical protein